VALHDQAPAGTPHENLDLRPQLASLIEADIPRYRLPAGELPPETAYQLVHDELLLDGSARLNLATFVTTWMEPPAERLIGECLDKNLIDKDEYPQTADLELRCVSILADLWSSPEAEQATGCSTTGSSEGCMLAGLALERRWAKRRRAAGLPAERPNLVMGANVQVCWEKFCRYWDVEPRLVPVGEGHTHLTPERAAAACDDATIGVVAIMGSTFDGSYEPVGEIAAALDRLERDRGLDVPVHVDAASGGFVTPFLDPALEWDFRVPRVCSINASGHKYGLVYPGVGWIVWRTHDELPDELVFHVDYLGGDMPTFGLNFSRPGAHVVAQYYMLLRLGREGFRKVQQACRDTARWLAAEVAKLGPFELISDGAGIPAFAFRLREEIDGYSVYDVSELLRTRGWIVPAYKMPESMDDVAVLRVVVRNGFGPGLAHLLIEDLGRTLERLERGAPPPERRSSFHH
jgi:glutamate decarboxylase